MCQGAIRVAIVKFTKKFAPEIEVPAQMNQNCAFVLAIRVEYVVDVAHPVPCCWQEQREFW
jgi:hypothetical protein